MYIVVCTIVYICRPIVSVIIITGVELLFYRYVNLRANFTINESAFELLYIELLYISVYNKQFGKSKKYYNFDTLSLVFLFCGCTFYKVCLMLFTRE